MPMLHIFKRHTSLARMADAYADAELRGRDLSTFERHLPGCGACLAAVESARSLKASIASLPEALAPRSFRLTPAMVEAAPPARPRAATPVYLNFARIAAVVAVGAFVSFVAATALDSSDSKRASGENDASAIRPLSAEAAGGAPATAGASDKAAPTLPTPNIAPPGGTGVSGAGAVSPEASPLFAGSEDSGDLPTPATAQDASREGFEPVPGVTSFEPYNAVETDEDGVSPWLVGSGALAAALVAAVAVLEVRRRKFA